MKSSNLREDAGHSLLDILDQEQLDRAIGSGHDASFVDHDDIYQLFYDYYLDSGAMPVGTAKARDGDPHNWIEERIWSDYHEEIYQLTDQMMNQAGAYDDDLHEMRRLAGLPMLESDSPQFAKGDRVQVKDHVQRWGGKSGKITVVQGKHYMVKVDRARSGEVEFLGSELTKAADVSESYEDSSEIIAQVSARPPGETSTLRLSLRADGQFRLKDGPVPLRPLAIVTAPVRYEERQRLLDQASRTVRNSQDLVDILQELDPVRKGMWKPMDPAPIREADVKVDEARSDSWSRKINKILGWGLTSPREIQQRVRELDDSTLKQLYTLLPPGAGASSGSERNLQLKIIDQEMKRRHGLTPKGNIRESEEMVTKRVVGHEDREARMMQRELLKIRDYAQELCDML
ncbi:MAG: hypothetical protein ACRC16_01015, partial [Aeromonas salmonicida]